MIDYSTIANSIANTIAKGGKPLTETQRPLLVGALAVWLDKLNNKQCDTIEHKIY